MTKYMALSGSLKRSTMLIMKVVPLLWWSVIRSTDGSLLLVSTSVYRRAKIFFLVRSKNTLK